MIIAALMSLFSVVNPLGAVPVFLAMTPHDTKAERTRTALSTMIYFILILMSFYLAGSFILQFFGLSLHSLRIAGGLVILSSGYSLLKGQFEESRAINSKVKTEAIAKDDISFTPLAMPLLAGPGSISLLIAMNAETPMWIDKLQIMGVVLAMGGIVFLILSGATLLFRVLGHSGLKAISRIMGFLVMAIGIQYMISGAVELIETLS